MASLSCLALSILVSIALLTGSPAPAFAQHFAPTAALEAGSATDSGDDNRPSAATDGAGNWVAVWDSADSLGATIGTDLDIFIARSTDNGVTWSLAAALNTNAATDSGEDVRPDVATDGAGNWVAVWRSTEDLGGTIGSDDDLLVARSTDNGATWTTPVALNTNAATDTGEDNQPDLVTDGAGNWVVAWISDDDLGTTIGADRDVLVARSIDNGATWMAPAALNTNAATDFGEDLDVQVDTDGSGNWVAGWTSNENLGGALGFDFDVLVARSTDNGATWTAPASLKTYSDSVTDGGPELANDGAGHWVAIWDSEDDLAGTIGFDSDILVARSTDNGLTWTAPSALNTNAGVDSGGDGSADIATDGAGNWMAVWSSFDILGGTIGFDSDVLVALSTDNGTTWTAPVPLNSNAASDSGADLHPDLSTDGTGTWLATWGSTDDLGGTIGTDSDILGVLGGLCDDGFACTQDSFETGTGCVNDSAPVDAGSCLVAPRTKFQIKNSVDPAKDQLKWQWNKGDQLDQSDLGTPDVATTYTLCVYDTSSSAPSLATSLEIAASPSLWLDKAPKGYLYKDRTGASDGVTKVQFRTGPATRAKAKLQAKGVNLALPVPFGGTYFEQDPNVVVQLVNSEGLCLTSQFDVPDNKKSDATQFKALTK